MANATGVSVAIKDFELVTGSLALISGGLVILDIKENQRVFFKLFLDGQDTGLFSMESRDETSIILTDFKILEKGKHRIEFKCLTEEEIPQVELALYRPYLKISVISIG